MKISYYIALGLLGYIPSVASFAETPAIGWIERVHILPANIQFIAKIDTGADNSSLHATDIEIHDAIDGKRVRFVVQNRNGETARLDLPLVRMASIKRKNSDPLVRPVVWMQLCLGHIKKTTEVNLANRSNFEYRMLIGRSYLQNTYLVDSSKQETSAPACLVEE